MKYATINAQYFAKPTAKKVLNFLKGFMGKDVEKIEKQHFMSFFERWYLLLQRIGYYKEKNQEYVFLIDTEHSGRVLLEHVENGGTQTSGTYCLKIILIL